jgi:multidrug transporter EmrE-like cation transporter
VKWLILILGILSNAAASALLKTASALTVNWGQPLSNGNLRLSGAMLLYLSAFLLYALVLQRLPLAVAHPIMTAGAIVIVGLLAAFVFGENITVLQAAGYGFLLVGILCIALSQSGSI